MTDPATGVYISPDQMYQEVRALSDTILRIESKIDGLRDDVREVREEQADHEDRLRAQERQDWPLPTIGALTGVAGAVAAAAALFLK